MPLVDITNDIKRSLKQNNQKNGVVVVANQKSHLLDGSPSHLKRISVAKTNEDDDEEEQQPPTRARDSSRLSAGSGSSPFSKVSVEGPGEFLESEPSLSAKSDDLSNGNRRGSSGSEASVEQREERRTEEEEEEEEKQPVVVQQLRQSRRQKHQPQRLGDLLEWNDIKSNALYEKYDPEKEQRLLEQVQMEKEKLRRIEEEEKSKSSSSNNNNNSSGSGRRASGGKKKLGVAVSTSAASSSSYQSGHQSQAVMEVHQRVADLMKMAEQMLPPEEEEEVDDGLPKKSIREKLRDAWDGDGYYAKLMKEQDGPSSSSSSSSSNGDSNNNNNNNNSSNAIKKTVSKANNNNGKKEGLKVYCDKENPVAHKVNRAKKAGGGLGGGGGLSSSSSKLAVGCGNNATTIGGLANSAPQPLVQRTALASALGNVTNNASSSSSSNNINNTISGTTYMFGNLKSIQAPSNLSSSSTHSLSSDRSTSTSPSSSSSASAASSAKETNETLLALKAENDLLRKQRNDVKLQHLKLKKELDDLKKNARIAVSKLCAKLPNNSRGVELDALAFLKLN
jgi:hypothetical protein